MKSPGGWQRARREKVFSYFVHLLARKCANGLFLQISVRIAAHVYDHLLDDAAGEVEWRLVVAADRLATIAPNAEALAHQREVAQLRLDLCASHCFIANIERRGPSG